MNPRTMIYHITTPQAWADARRNGEYRAGSLATEGFIHCSTETQVLPVAANYYRGQTGLLLLAIDPSRLSSALKWEAPSGGTPPPGVPEGELFPHIYGSLNLDAVVHAFDLETGADGQYRFPATN